MGAPQTNSAEVNEALVTVAFKTDRKRKNYLMQRAEEMGLSLSSYVDSQLIFTEENDAKYQTDIANLQERLKFYEQSHLQNFLKQLQGKHFNFIDQDGNQIELTVKTVADVFTLLVNSFKLQ